VTMYNFYSIIEKVEDEEVFIVTFPDIESCFTSGETLVEAIEMAEDALGLYLSVLEDEGEQIPAPSKADAISIPDGASLVLITVDTDHFR
jgi:antitoxin HicB